MASMSQAICLRHSAYMANFETSEELMLMKYELKKMNTDFISVFDNDWRWIKHGKMTKMTYFAFDSSEPNGSFLHPRIIKDLEDAYNIV
ncbi:uncharacterized protein LOC134694468 [Mytilus trossulus]|uniref:uncharacterized protein LOC134694468 n=1 Tax=Mytilus trossulus TaxID=6551 RepID=UPI0030059AF5